MAANLAPGATLASYRIVRLLGRGGMGEVYLAEDQRLRREVALKVLAAEIRGDPAALQRFQREAEAAAALHHPNICTIFEIGEAHGHTFLVMELCEGVTLRERIAEQPLPVEDALDLAIQIADALEEARRRRVVHRDIKSSNLLVSERGQVKILDFGLAKQFLPRGAEFTQLSTELDVTGPGIPVGTPHFMSPEQMLGRTVDHRSDLFSFGVVLYEMLTGTLPFRGDTTVALIDAILREEPAPVERYNERVPAPLARVVAKLLAKSPDQRYQSAHEVWVELRRIRDELPRAGAGAPETPRGATAGALTTAEAAIGDEDDALVPSAASVASAGEPTASASAVESAPASPLTRDGSPIRRSALGDRRRIVTTAAAFTAILALVAVTWSTTALRRRASSLDPTARPITSLVALPAKVAAAAELAYLTDAVPSTISTQLTRLEGIDTKLPPTSFEVEKVDGDLQRLAELYGVDAFVVSSVVSDARGMLVNVQLVDAHTRTLLWSGEYEGTRGEYLRLARGAADGIREFIQPRAQPLATVPAAPARSEAELAFQQGTYYLNRFNHAHERDDLDKATAALQRALELDPEMADAAAQMAALLSFQLEAAGAYDAEAVAAAERWARRAVELDERCGKGWSALAHQLFYRPDADPREYREYGVRAAYHGPREGLALAALPNVTLDASAALQLVGFEEVRRVEPLYLYPYTNSAERLLMNGRSLEALPLIEHVLALEPAMPMAVPDKGLVLVDLGRLEEAERVLEQVDRMVAGGRVPKAFALSLRVNLALERDGTAAAAGPLADLLELLGDPPTPRFVRAYVTIYSLRSLVRHDESEAALEMLELSAGGGYAQYYDWLLLNRDLAPLRSDPRFQRILERSRAGWDGMIEVLDEAKARGELPAFLEQPLAEHRREIEAARAAADPL